MIERVNFEPVHMENIRLKEEQANEIATSHLIGPAITFKKGDTVLGVFGAKFPTSGVLHGWAFVSEDVGACPIAFHKSVLELLTYLEEKFNLRRIQFTVRVDYNIGLRWAWALGFQQEGILRGYGPDGTDYAIFGRVRKCQESK